MVAVRGGTNDRHAVLGFKRRLRALCKLEAFAVRFQDDTTGAAYAAGLGYRF